MLGFVGEWNRAIESDSVWQFEELEEEDPELAEAVGVFNAVCMLAYKRLQSRGVYVSYEEVCEVALLT